MSQQQPASVQQQLVDSLHRLKKFFDTSTAVLDEADSAFAPADGMYTTAQQVAHVAHTFEWFLDGMFGTKGYDLDFAGIDRQVRQVTSLKDARAWLDRAVSRAAEVLTNATDEQLNSGVENDPILDGMPRRAIVWALEDHTAHHRGALTVYARLRGKAAPMPYG